jgi:hypothetical protein
MTDRAERGLELHFVAKSRHAKRRHSGQGLGGVYAEELMRSYVEMET